MGLRKSWWILFSLLLLPALISLACSSEEPAAAATPGVLPAPASPEGQQGHALFISKGCAGCHGESAEGTSIAPALAGHTPAMVERQVRTPRFRMPAFSVRQVTDDELGAITRYIAGLEGEGHLHAEVPPSELSVAVEMHHWMALESLKADSADDAIHHIGHIVGLLEEGDHRVTMEAILVSLQAGETHGPQHEIEEMVAGTVVPGLALSELHLRQSLVALAVADVADAQHHVSHFQETASADELSRAAEILELLGQGDLHDAEHEIKELLGEEEHDD
ncbi:MAG: c-type cytochrome [Chloroflexi bacterium]|nr:c-type cytochrome [Chloroflexota bacterium]